MYYHINAFKQTDKKKYQLDFALEGDLDMIKDWLEEKEIITLSINAIKEEELQKIGTIHADIYHHKDNNIYTIITHHSNIAQACLLLMFLGFDVKKITDTNTPLTPEQSDKLIAMVQAKIHEQQEKIRQKTQEDKKKQNNVFDDQRLIKLKEIANETQNDIRTLIQKVQGTVSPTIIKELEDISGNLQKYARGTNANKISVTLKQAFSLMEEIELQLIDDNKEEEITLIKDSLISNVDILNEYNKRKKASQIKEVGEKSADPDDKYYLFFGKIGIYTKFLRKEYLHKLSKGNYVTTAIVAIINYISILMPALYAGVILWSKITDTGTTEKYLMLLSHVAIYMGFWAAWYTLTKKRTTLTLLGIPLVIGVGYFFSLILYNTFAL